MHRVEDRGGGADGALGVVLVRLRDAESGHDRVAGELLDDAAVRGDAMRDVLEERVDAPAHDLGIAHCDELGRADEIDEERLSRAFVPPRNCSYEPLGYDCCEPRPPACASVSACSIPRPSKPTTSAALSRRAGRGRRVRDRPRLRRAVRAEADRRRPRHATLLPVHVRGIDRRRRRRRRGRARPGDGRDGDGLFRRRRARGSTAASASPRHTTRSSTRG